MNLDTLKMIMEAVQTPLGTFRMGEDKPPPAVGISPIPKWDMTGGNARPPVYQGPLWLQFVCTTDLGVGVSAELHRGRKWRISRHSTEREVVGTAFMALLAFVEHEAREGFTWNDHAIFGPHIGLFSLADATLKEVDRRKG